MPSHSPQTEVPSADVHATANAVVSAMHARLRERGRAEAVARFADLLFRRAPEEDLAALEGEDLADLAEDGHVHLAHRQGGRHRIRVFDRETRAGGEVVPITVVEVLNDDMPFLFDSVTGAMVEVGHEILLVVHPVLAVRRDDDGRLIELLGEAGAGHGGDRESLIHVHLTRLSGEAAREGLIAALDATLDDVRAAVDDWKAMLKRLGELVVAYRWGATPLEAHARDEALAFLEWLGAENFTFLGMREYACVETDGGAYVEPLGATGLGTLRDPEVRVLKRGAESLNAAVAIGAFARSGEAMMVTKSNIRSRIHRRVHMDYVGVKLWGDDGRMTGELRILGLFTAEAYNSSVRAIPLVREKVERVIAGAGLTPGGHSAKALHNVLEGFPRDELLQIDEATLREFALAILALEEHPRIRVLARRDPFDRFVSVLVFVPRDRFTTDLRRRIGELLETRFDGKVVSWQTAHSEGPLTRIHFIVGRYHGQTPEVARERLERDVAALVRTWRDDFVGHLRRLDGEPALRATSSRWADAFGAAYREAMSAAIAVADAAVMEGLTTEMPLAVRFYRRDGEAAERLALKLFHLDRPIALSERVPVLEAMGLGVVDESTYRIAPEGGPTVFLHDMTLMHGDGCAVDLHDGLTGRLEDLFAAVFSGRAESDGFDALVLLAGLDRREVAMLRSVGRWLRQIRTPWSQDWLWRALHRHPGLAVDLVTLFRVRLDPAHTGDRDAAEARVRESIETALAQVASLEDDTIVRRFAEVIGAMVRTDFFRPDHDGRPRDTLAFKLAPGGIEDLPAPRPHREIWVCGPTVEGVHLRFGPVARGGLRWSDRAQDFRTEVLGLVKAQQVKNAVIVPVGAKGGFFPKKIVAQADRERVQAEGIAAYRTFVGRLLDLTDDIADGATVAPEAVVRRDGDDPYLVVAADKGTATFSDIANGIAREHGFWLDDAFASGGSAGYDHKKMGITARGAFEAVKRHFGEMDVDIATTPFTVAGVGDMSGDVFGNGMLLARTIRLVAAFDHRHVFLDPNPDPEISFEERARLFVLPRSSWADYDPAKISAGGGVFARTAKSMPLSAEVRALLGLDADHAAPSEVIRAILRAKVDLLWFGGIGTYVRAATESDAQVGDKANDAVRITAGEIGAGVVGEGANLGMTQGARIEYGARGGRCNSDAIDNSAGVNCSDVEVNIKVALAPVVAAGRLTRAARDRLLAEMTDEVAERVLANNRSQTLSISTTMRAGLADLPFQRRLVAALERAGGLDRRVETLPDDAGFAARAKAGRAATRAEVGVMLAHAKLAAKAELIATPVPDDPWFEADLLGYFPDRLVADFAAEVRGHRLRREIVTTRLVNAMIDRGGATFLTRVGDRTGADTATIARAQAVATAVFGLERAGATVEGLGAAVASAVRLDLTAALRDLLIEATVWFVRNVDFDGSIGAMVERFAGPVERIVGGLEAAAPESVARVIAAERERSIAAGIGAEAVALLAGIGRRGAALDVALLAETSGAGLDEVTAAWFGLGERIGLDRLAEAARATAVEDYFEGIALDRAVRGFEEARRRLVGEALAGGGVAAWAERRAGELDRVRAAVRETLDGATEGGARVARFTVAAALFADLIGRG